MSPIRANRGNKSINIGGTHLKWAIPREVLVLVSVLRIWCRAFVLRISEDSLRNRPEEYKGAAASAHKPPCLGKGN